MKMPSIEFGCQQSNITLPDVEMFPGFEFLDEKFFSCDDNDVFQSFSTKLGIPLTLEEETIEDIVRDTMSSPIFEELNLNIIQDNSEYSFEETKEIKNEIKSEPGSPKARYCTTSNFMSAQYSESNDSDGQIMCLMQDVSDSIENFTLETPLLSLPYTLSSPQSDTSSAPTPNQFNIIQKNVPISQQDIKHDNYSFAETDKNIFMCPTGVKNGKSHDMTGIPNYATVIGYTTNLEQMLPSPTCQVLSKNEPISIQNSSSVDLIGTKTPGINPAFQLPQNVKIINTVSNIRSASTIESIDTPRILNNDSVVCNIITSDPINSTSFQLMQSETSSSPLIVTDDLVSLTRNGDESRIKALKRQQRMIKNRESACLSRKKRKEYVSSLERKVFELKEVNKQLKSENEILKQRLIEMKDSITCENKKFANLSFESSLKTKARKHVAIFLSLAIMISINIGSLSGLSGTFSQNAKYFHDKPDNLPITMPEIVHTRRLLWTIDENNNMDNQIDENFNKSIPLHPVCPMYINQSESIRLDSELRRWIDGESDNRTMTKGTKLETGSLNIVLSRSSLEEKPKRRLYLSRDRKIKTISKHKMIDIHPADQYSNDNAIQVFSPILSEHASLFEALGRKDDTFYVVWFSGEHLLLPASRKNDTARPKISLVLPAVSINGTFSTPPKHITMMQIDCEVTNTQLLHLQQSIIPVHLRNGKSTTNQSNRSHSVEDIVDPSMANLTKNYKPYFMKEANRKQRYRKDIV